MNDLISVIVPVYNVEAYLDRCVGSIVDQTYKKLEIILVDDGSTDSSGNICDAWAEKDARIKVLHLENGGAGKARNIGIEAARGVWCALIDSDDYISSDMIESLYSMIGDETDLSECGIVYTELNDYPFPVKTKEDGVIRCGAGKAFEYHIANSAFCQTPPNKLYRTSIIKNIPFPTGKLIDDEFWTYRVIGECRELARTSRILYAYRQQASSVMHRSYSAKRLQVLDAKYQRCLYLNERFPENANRAKIDYLETCIYHGQMILTNLKGNEKKEALVELKKYYSSVGFKMKEVKHLSLSHRTWLALSKISLTTTCRLKNILKVGI